MSDTLLIRYPIEHPSAECNWLRVDAEANAHGTTQHGTLAEAAAAAENARVILVLPGDAVAQATPTLPPGSGKRLAALVPFALEDQVAAELETLHFAIGAQTADGAVETAIIDRDTLSAHLSTLAAHGLTPAAAYGTTQLTPVIPATTVILIEDQRLNVRQPDGSAYCADLLPNLETAQCLSLSETEPSACVVYTTATAYTNRLDLLPNDTGLPAGGSYVGSGPQFLENGPLQKYAEMALRHAPVNLLQGPFAPPSSAAAGWARWRVASFVLLACVLVNVLASGVDWLRAHREEARLDTELHAAYAQALPGVEPSRLPAPRLIVESHVRRLNGSGQDGLLGKLEMLGAAVNATAGVSVKSVNFHDGALEALLTAGDLASLNQVQQAMGPQARLAGVSTPDPQHAEGRLEINGGGR